MRFFWICPKIDFGLYKVVQRHISLWNHLLQGKSFGIMGQVRVLDKLSTPFGKAGFSFYLQWVPILLIKNQIFESKHIRLIQIK